jgi:hypothetical protein
MKSAWVITVILVLVARFILSRVTRVSTPPATVRLAAVRASAAHARDLKARVPALEACGFRSIGTFRVDPMRGVMLTAFAQPEQSLCAVVYSHPLVKSFVDMISKTDDDRSLTVTTAPAGQELDQPPGHEKIFDTSLSIAQMYDLLLRRRPRGSHEEWNADNFAVKFETAYAKELNWRRSRGGVTHDEVRRVAETTGSKVTEEQIGEATRRLQREYTSASRGETR